MKSLLLLPSALLSGAFLLSTQQAWSQSAPARGNYSRQLGESFLTRPTLSPTLPSPRQSTGQGRYAWRTQIVTTTFWVGEAPTTNNPVPNHVSSWDSAWAVSFGGTDDPDPAQRANYLPVAFVPRQNPFYVALPYNDKMKTGHKPEAPLVIPWFKTEFRGPGKSVCKGRWIAIKFQERICYAQWEDCGPFRTDHWQYVFGQERPKANLNRGAGLDVSPAVRDYLGMAGTDVTDWRFVDFEEVPRGPWATHGENNSFVIKQRIEQERLASGRTSAGR